MVTELSSVLYQHFNINKHLIFFKTKGGNEMRKGKYVVIGLGLAMLILMSSCSTVANAVVGGAVRGVGRAASERAANAVYKKLAPKEKLPAPATPGWNQFMVAQAQIVFGY